MDERAWKHLKNLRKRKELIKEFLFKKNSAFQSIKVLTEVTKKAPQQQVDLKDSQNITDSITHNLMINRIQIKSYMA